MIITIYLVFILTLLTGGWLMVRKKSRAGKWMFSLSLFFLLFEIGSVILLYLYSGELLYFRIENRNKELFEPHPYMIGTNRRNINKVFNGYHFSNNSRGFRGPEFGAKNPGVTRIAVLGGSTSYGVGVNNHETWPFYLDSLLGNNYEVLNLGVPGHSTVEHIIMASFILPELDPEIVLVHTGLNDLRNSHVDTLLPDYSNFHAPTIYGSLGFCYREELPPVASLRVIVLLLQKAGWYPVCMLHRAKYEGHSSGEIDQEVLKLYRRNLETLLAILDQRQRMIYFLPQVLSEDNFKEGNYQWWAPYLPDTAIKPTSDAFNAVMREVATGHEKIYAVSLSEMTWKPEDFSDPSHLNSSGNLKFAREVYAIIKASRDTIPD